MANNIFSPKRFGEYFTLYGSVNWKTFTLRTLIIFAVLIFYSTFIPYITDTYIISPNNHAQISEARNTDMFWSREVNFVSFIFFIVSIVWSSYMFSAMLTKSNRISTLTIPASSFEKFITYFIYYIVAVYIIFFIAVYVADFARILSTHLYHHDDVCIKPLPLDSFINHGNEIGDFSPKYAIEKEGFASFLNAVSYGSLFLSQAFMALISCISPKNSFMKGLGIAFILFVLSIICFSSGVVWFGDIFETKPDINTNINSVAIFTWCAFYISAIGLFILSYFRFKENEIINRW